MIDLAGDTGPVFRCTLCGGGWRPGGLTAALAHYIRCTGGYDVGE